MRNFAFQTGGEISHAKFRFSADFSHTSGTHCGLWRVAIHSTRGLREISLSEIYHREFDMARKFPPSCIMAYLGNRYKPSCNNGRSCNSPHARHTPVIGKHGTQPACPLQPIIFQSHSKKPKHTPGEAPFVVDLSQAYAPSVRGRRVGGSGQLESLRSYI